jgi:hypothetical protein
VSKGDLGETFRLIDGLSGWPESMYRAAYLADNPPAQGCGGGRPRLTWLGLDQSVLVLAQLANVVVQALGGKPVFDMPATAGEDPVERFKQIIMSA